MNNPKTNIETLKKRAKESEDKLRAKGLVKTNCFGWVKKTHYDMFAFIQDDNGIPSTRMEGNNIVTHSDYLIYLELLAKERRQKLAVKYNKPTPADYDVMIGERESSQLIAEITKVHPRKKMARGDKYFIRLEFKTTDKTWAKTDICPSFRNYSNWKDIINLGVGTRLINLRYKSEAGSEIDADCKPTVIKK